MASVSEFCATSCGVRKMPTPSTTPTTKATPCETERLGRRGTAPPFSRFMRDKPSVQGCTGSGSAARLPLDRLGSGLLLHGLDLVLAHPADEFLRSFRRFQCEGQAVSLKAHILDGHLFAVDF